MNSRVPTRNPELPRVFCSLGLAAHPYPEQLYSALERRGLELSDVPDFWVVRHIRPSPGAVLHLQWTERYLLSKDRPRTLLKLALFAAQLAYLKLRGVRIVWTVHNLKNHENSMPKLDHWGSCMLARLADRLIVHCNCALDLTRARFKLRDVTKFHVIPHGHFVHRYELGPSRPDARASLDLPIDGDVFLVFGLIRPYKGLDRLLELFAEVRERGQTLVIAGATYGAMDPSWPAQAQARYPWLRIFPRHISDEELPTFFRAADVALFPYRDILTSGAMILAMGFGLPCVAPRAGCVPETLGRGGGPLFEPDSDASLRQALLEVAERREQWTEMGENNRQRAHSWDWDTIAERTLDAYEGSRPTGSTIAAE